MNCNECNTELNESNAVKFTEHKLGPHRSKWVVEWPDGRKMNQVYNSKWNTWEEKESAK